MTHLLHRFALVLPTARFVSASALAWLTTTAAVMSAQPQARAQRDRAPKVIYGQHATVAAWSRMIKSAQLRGVQKGGGIFVFQFEATADPRTRIQKQLQ